MSRWGLLMRRFLIPLLIFVGLTQIANAADSTVTALPAASALSGPELLYCIQGAADKKCTATQVGAFANGVFNVRSQYGAVPNGSTDNATFIANAFTAANAYTGTGNPTVYFDCNNSTTVCTYNYGGAGTSPINPTRAMTIQCAPGVALNYTGTANAADIGASGRTQVDTDRYLITGCNFTGGANYTQGISINNFIANAQILDNVFTNFGNRTGYTIKAVDNNWELLIGRNYWRDTDGVTKNILDAHSSHAAGLRFFDNGVECEDAGGAACSVSTTGVGLWVTNGFIVNNTIQFHYPLIRISQTNRQSALWIDHNHFEGNFGGLGPAITYGDPSGTGVGINYVRVTNNFLFWPVATNTNVLIGPESAGTGSYNLGDLTLLNNYMSTSSTVSGTGLIIQTNGGPGGGQFSNNLLENALVTPASTGFIDSGQEKTNNWAVSSHIGNSTTLANQLPVFDSNGQNLNVASFHNIGVPLVCADVSGSGTAKSCSTSPSSDAAGSAIVIQTNDTIIFTSTTGNTGALTVVVNGGSALPVKKTGGTAALVNGDMKAGGRYPMIFDGTNLQVILGN